MQFLDTLRSQATAAVSAFALSLVLIAGTVTVPADSATAADFDTVIAANLA